ncbi:uncharacterized protein PAC_17547 [Phialocephala subalpina]|uniref:Major facilitator superfamily (MFS) profile domain-containing protein n=1 Tax=Phialocephala subalpina TaxID=576137 RepID=A0A1L7XRS6_9HELO|nr:uncharacterized protein PAC_17547 [Phialocephala subalpina]
MANSRKEPRLPVGQLAIICISRFGVPLMLNSFPVYLLTLSEPALLSSFNISTDTVPYYVGVCSAIWSISTCVTAPLWGRASDSYGRKPAIILSNIIYVASVLIFGFAGRLWLILAVMGLLGFAGGMTPVLHTTVAELVTEKELQPMAFSLIPLMWTISSMIGPMIGGFLADPAQKYPNLFGDNMFFLHFPYSLPNLVVATPFVIGCVTGILFLKETLKGKNSKDSGLRLGRVLQQLILCSKMSKPLEKIDEAEYHMLDQNDSATRDQSSDRTSYEEEAKPALLSPSTPSSSRWLVSSLFPSSIFTRQSMLALLYICFLQTHSKLFDEFLPTYMQAVPSPSSPAPGSTSPPPSLISSLILFPGGLSLSAHTSALYLTAYGLSAIFIQLAIFPRLAPYLGPLRSLRIASFTYPVIYLLTPYLSLLSPFTILRGACIVVLLAMKACCGIFAFPCSRILLCNSATKGGLGTLNGISSSSQQLMRAVIAVGVGKLFSLGMERSVIVLPWWSLSVVSLGGLGTVVWLRDESDREEEAGDASHCVVHKDTMDEFKKLPDTIEKSAGKAVEGSVEKSVDAVKSGIENAITSAKNSVEEKIGTLPSKENVDSQFGSIPTGVTSGELDEKLSSVLIKEDFEISIES